MKSFLSRICFSVIYIVPLVALFSSCDEKEEKPENHIVFNGKKYIINEAKLQFFGEADLRHMDPDIGVTHYYHTVQFSDGNIDPSDGSIEGGTLQVRFSVFTTMNDHSHDQISGTFPPVHPQDFFGSKAPLDENFYTFFILRHDDNGDGVFDQTETWYDGLTGEVSISKSGETYTITIDTSDPVTNRSANGKFTGVLEAL